MGEVFTEKITIPMDKLDEYVDRMKKTQEERRPLREFLEVLNEEFYDQLVTKWSTNTAAMVTTHFPSWSKRKV